MHESITTAVISYALVIIAMSTTNQTMEWNVYFQNSMEKKNIVNVCLLNFR